MEPVRYKPGEAIRWLETGAEAARELAKRKGREAASSDGAGFERIGQGVGALVDLGKSAWTDIVHRQAEASQYVLQETHFDVVAGTSIKSLRYADVKRIAVKHDKAVLTLVRGATITIKPYAYITAGRIRVPVGWLRNGMEVPYALLIEELAARCGVEVDVN